MAHVLRPLIQLPRRRHPLTFFRRLISFHSTPPPASNTPTLLLFSTTALRSAHFRSRAQKLGAVTSRAARNDSSDDEDSSDNSEPVKKSRNEMKREAQRAVRWGMQLANFSPDQIKRILRVADLGEDVYDAIILVKTFDRDVREGKRRQYNYIGRLLREIEPELMEGLIQATKDGDYSMFQNVPSPETQDTEDEEEGEEEEIAEESDEEESIKISVAARWYDGLINKDKSITSEIYSLQEVEFDSQELRRLVRQVHSTLADDSSLEEDNKVNGVAVKARRSLQHFLRKLVMQLPDESYLLE